MGTRAFVNERSTFPPSRKPAGAARSTDIRLILTVIALAVFGLIMLYSASFDFSFNEYGSSTYMFVRQVKWLGLGIGVAFMLSLFDYHNWRRVVFLAILGTIVFLLTVLNIN
jgi:cell division protein FtsW